MPEKSNKNVLVVSHVVNEFFGRGNLENYEEFIAPDIEIHCPKSWEGIHKAELTTCQNTKKIDQEYAQAFDFRRMSIDDLLCDKDRVAVRWSGVGIHKNSFFSIPATEQSFNVCGQTIYRLNQGSQIVEVWQSWDLVGVFRQMGFDFRSPSINDKEVIKLRKKAELLSLRERMCLRFMLDGNTSKETAEKLSLSFRTVEYYFENLKNKLDCSCKRELFRLARLLEQCRFI